MSTKKKLYYRLFLVAVCFIFALPRAMAECESELSQYNVKTIVKNTKLYNLICEHGTPSSVSAGVTHMYICPTSGVLVSIRCDFELRCADTQAHLGTIASKCKSSDCRGDADSVKVGFEPQFRPGLKIEQEWENFTITTDDPSLLETMCPPKSAKVKDGTTK